MRSCAGVAASTTTSSIRRDLGPARVARVASLLAAIAMRDDLRNAPQLRKVSLHGDRVDLDVDERWALLPTLIARVRSVKGVREIRVNGRPARRRAGAADPARSRPDGQDSAAAKMCPPSADTTRPEPGPPKWVPMTSRSVSATSAMKSRRGLLAAAGVGVEVRAPLGRRELHRVVHEVAGDQRRRAARRQPHAAVAGRVAGRRHQRHAGRDLGVDVDEVDEPGRHDRLDGVEELGRVVVRLGPVPVLGPGDAVAALRERRLPLAVDERRVPADVVDVEVRAHHGVDRQRIEPGLAEAVEERQLQVVPRRDVALLVVADARVDHDRLAAGLDDEGLDPREQHPVVVDERAAGPAVAFGEDVRRRLAEQELARAPDRRPR